MPNFTVDVTPPASAQKTRLHIGESSSNPGALMLSTWEIYGRQLGVELKAIKLNFDPHNLPAKSSVDIKMDGKTVQTISADMYNKASELLGYGPKVNEGVSLIADYTNHIVERRPAPPEKFQDYIADALQFQLGSAKERGDKDRVGKFSKGVKEWGAILPAGSKIEAISQRIGIEEHILKGLRECNADSLSSATGDPIKDATLLAATVKNTCKAR